MNNAIDFRVFQPRPASGSLHVELGIDTTCPLLLAVGQIGIRKGLDTTLQAFERSRPQDSNAHLVIVGERNSGKQEAIDYESSLRDFAAKNSLNDRVHFLGRRADVPRLLNEATLLVHLARQEPLGRVLLEAAASRCCVVASDVGGTAEIFPPGSNTAILVPPDEPTRAATQMARLLAEPHLRTQIAEHGYRRVRTKFTIEAHVDGLIAVYRAVIPS